MLAIYTTLVWYSKYFIWYSFLLSSILWNLFFRDPTTFRKSTFLIDLFYSHNHKFTPKVPSSFTWESGCNKRKVPHTVYYSQLQFVHLWLGPTKNARPSGSLYSQSAYMLIPGDTLKYINGPDARKEVNEP